MSELFLFAIPLAGLVAALLVLPLWRRNRNAATRADYDLAVFQDQLAEIERDAERGLLEAKQAEAARLEVQRRILAVDPPDPRRERPEHWWFATCARAWSRADDGTRWPAAACSRGAADRAGPRR